MGDTLTYAAHRALLPAHSLVREYGVGDLTSFPATGHDESRGEREVGSSVRSTGGCRRGAFADWRLIVEGRVARPRIVLARRAEAAPVADADHAAHLRGRLDRDRPVDRRAAVAVCWTPSGILPTARFVVLHSVDDWVDSLDLIDALHPQTILAYGMNGGDLPIAHGAPVRLRLERQIGYKSMKYVRRLVVADEFDDGGTSGSIQNGWAWYNGI